ncbi:hypothetical protein BHM03_00001128 [Ensete ventricosum]|nr:hypothetical protein BHM03_00001128 [Ensete ventricosum]
MASVVLRSIRRRRELGDSHLPGCGVRNGGRQGEGGGSPDAGTLPSASQIGRLRSRLHPLAFLLVSILIPNQDLVVFTDFLGLGFCLLPLARLRPKMLETDDSGGHGNHLDKWVGDLDSIVSKMGVTSILVDDGVNLEELRSGLQNYYSTNSASSNTKQSD